MAGTQTTSHLATFWEVSLREAWSQVESGELQEKPMQHLRIGLCMFVHCGNCLRLPTTTNSVATLPMFLLWAAQVALVCSLAAFFLALGTGCLSKRTGMSEQVSLVSSSTNSLRIARYRRCNVFERTLVKLFEIPERRSLNYEWSGAWSFSRTRPRWLWCSQAG